MIQIPIGNIAGLNELMQMLVCYHSPIVFISVEPNVVNHRYMFIIQIQYKQVIIGGKDFL